jgi:hypothetical protein
MPHTAVAALQTARISNVVLNQRSIHAPGRYSFRWWLWHASAHGGPAPGCFFRQYCSSLKALLLITLALAPATNHCPPVLLNLIHLELLLLRSFEVHDHFPS